MKMYWNGQYKLPVACLNTYVQYKTSFNTSTVHRVSNPVCITVCAQSSTAMKKCRLQYNKAVYGI